MLRLSISALALCCTAGAALAEGPSAEAKKDLWCLAALAAAAQNAEQSGDKTGAASVMQLVEALGTKSAALLTKEGYSKDQQAALATEYIDKALADRESGTFPHTQEQCLAAAKR